MLFRPWTIVFTSLLIGSAYGAGVSRAEPVPATETDAGVPMVMIVKLRDGFDNDTVSVTVNGKRVYAKSGVSTDLTISYADSVEVPVDGTTAHVEVQVDGGPTGEKDIKVEETPYVEVWMSGGKMEIRESKDEIPML